MKKNKLAIENYIAALDANKLAYKNQNHPVVATSLFNVGFAYDVDY